MQNRPRSYDYASFSLADASTDVDVKATVAALFSNITVATRLILSTDTNITCKLNSTVLPSFPINIGDSPFQLPPEYLDVDNIFLSNSSGGSATIKVWLFG